MAASLALFILCRLESKLASVVSGRRRRTDCPEGSLSDLSRVARGFKTKLPQNDDAGQTPTPGKSTVCSWCGGCVPFADSPCRRCCTQRSCEPCISCEVWTSSCNAKPQERSAVRDAATVYCDRNCGVFAGRLFARALRSATIPQRRAEPEPSETETATVAPAPSETWKACPTEGDIHSKMCSTGRVDPFEVGYACTSIPDHQPDGRAAKQPLSRVWQSAKVLDDGKVVYIGHEQPIEVFRAKLANGREQLLTTEGWKLWILQRSALARYPKKAVIASKILMDEDAINEIIKNADIPDNVDATYMKSEDGKCTLFSWRDVLASKSKESKAE